MKTRHLLIALLAMASSVACNHAEPVVEQKLDLDKTEVSLAAKAGEATFNVTSNKDWTITPDAEWVSVDPASGSASDKAVAVKVTAEDNASLESRTAVLTVKAGDMTKTVKVTQMPVEGGDPVPDQPPFALKIYDLSSVSVTVEVEPVDKVSPYYMDVINEADFLQAQEYGFDDYMTWFIGMMVEQTGVSRAEVVSMVSSYGNDGFILTTLKPETTYYAFAVGIGEDGMTTTEVVYEKFRTPAKEVSENTFSIDVVDITAKTALVKADVTTDDTYIMSIEPANIVAGMSGEEIADYVIQSNIAWGGLEDITCSGDTEMEWMGKSGWDYVVVAFGYKGGAITTDVVTKEFSMGQGGDPAACSFSFSQEFDSFQMHLGIRPSDDSVVYICNFVKMTDLQALMAAHGSLDGAFGECLEMLIEDMIDDLGTRARVVDLISTMESQQFSIRYDHVTEYMQWAVPVDQNGNPTASFSFSSPFMTPEEAISDAAINIVDFKYYDGTELAALYPELSMAKGYAVVDLTVEPSSSAAHWWSYVALEDLTDRSRQVIINNLLMAPCEPDSFRQLVVAYWGESTIMGVAQDADGVYGPLLLEVIDLNKDGASPASEFQL